MEPLTIYPKHPEADAYRVGGSYAPYALVATDKRFTDAELAAEVHLADAICAHSWVDGEWDDKMQERYETILRFAMSEHFDGAS